VALAAADFNRDGHLDLATSGARDNLGALCYYVINSGDSTAFTRSSVHGCGGPSIQAADLNADGYPDLVASEDPYQFTPRVHVILSGAEGPSPVVAFVTADDARAVAVADFNGDGKLDVAVSNPDIDQVSILLNRSFPDPRRVRRDPRRGQRGDAERRLHVALTPATAATVTVDYATADGTATSGVDYGAVSGTLNLPAGTTTQTVSVPVLGDRDFELDETFFLNLGNPTAAEIGRRQGVGTIRNDDTGYALSVSDASASEGGTATFTVSMLEASPQTVTVNYATADGTAVAGLDYTATSDADLRAGQTSQTVSVACYRIRSTRQTRRSS